MPSSKKMDNKRPNNFVITATAVLREGARRRKVVCAFLSKKFPKTTRFLVDIEIKRSCRHFYVALFIGFTLGLLSEWVQPLRKLLAGAAVELISQNLFFVLTAATCAPAIFTLCLSGRCKYLRAAFRWVTLSVGKLVLDLGGAGVGCLIGGTIVLRTTKDFSEMDHWIVFAYLFGAIFLTLLSMAYVWAKQDTSQQICIQEGARDNE